MNVSERSIARSFGFDAYHYAKGRKAPPPLIVSILKAELSHVNRPLIVDLGCGTGLASRCMAEFGTVIGVDHDDAMLEHAAKCGRGPIYMKRDVRALPFTRHQADAVTAWSSLHWFGTHDTTLEVKRILKPGGLFFVVNKRGSFDHKAIYTRLLPHLLTGPIVDIKKRYRPKGLLELGGFTDVKLVPYVHIDEYTPDEALHYLLSVHNARLIPESHMDEALEILGKYIQKRSVAGPIQNKINFTIVSGHAR